MLNFTNYRRFLTHYIGHLPKKGRGEVSKIARHLNVSTTLVSQILSGEKDFSLEQAEGVANYLALPKALSNEERATFYSSHLYAAVWLYTSIGNKGKTIDDISKYFDLPRNKILEIIKFLHETNLCEEANGYYRIGTQSTHVEKGSPHLLHHYRNWRILAIQQSENISDEELMYTAAVSLSKKDFDILREDMVAFIKKFLKIAHESPAEEIAYLNLDFLGIKK